MSRLVKGLVPTAAQEAGENEEDIYDDLEVWDVAVYLIACGKPAGHSFCVWIQSFCVEKLALCKTFCV